MNLYKTFRRRPEQFSGSLIYVQFTSWAQVVEKRLWETSLLEHCCRLSVKKLLTWKRFIFFFTGRNCKHWRLKKPRKNSCRFFKKKEKKKKKKEKWRPRNEKIEDILRRLYRLHNTFLNVLTTGVNIFAETTQLFKLRNGFL